MRLHNGWIFAAATLALGILASSPVSATTIVINSGPNIKKELFRSDFAELAFMDFTFSLPDTASGDGLFRMFAGGDLNNLDIDRIDVSTGPFPNRAVLGTFAFPIADIHFTACENPPHTNPPQCPIPETVPNGQYNPNKDGSGVVVEGRRNASTNNAGIPGPIVPQSLLVGGTNLTISLSPHSDAGPAIRHLRFVHRSDRTFVSIGTIEDPGTGFACPSRVCADWICGYPASKADVIVAPKTYDRAPTAAVDASRLTTILFVDGGRGPG